MSKLNKTQCAELEVKEQRQRDIELTKYPKIGKNKMKAYILIYDNNEDYEDYWTSNVMVFLNKSKAETILAKINKFVIKQRALCPKVEFDNDELYNKTSAAKKNFIKKFKPIFGIEELIDCMIHDFYGNFKLKEIKLVK